MWKVNNVALRIEAEIHVGGSDSRLQNNTELDVVCTVGNGLASDQSYREVDLLGGSNLIGKKAGRPLNVCSIE